MKKDYFKIAKIIITSLLMLSLGIALWAQGYFFAKNFIVIYNPSVSQPSPQINAIEISAETNSIINSDTKETIFTIEGAQAYLESSGYAFDPDVFETTNAKYAGDCFINAVLSNNKDRMVFSTGCLAGDLPQAWIGVYEFDNNSDNNTKSLCGYNSNSGDFALIPKAEACAQSLVKFLIGGTGKNFVWSSDGRTIIYEADLGESGMTEVRMIDSETGEIVIDTSDWKTYVNNKHGFSFEYPKDWKITENSGNNLDDPLVIISSPEILKLLEEEKAINNGENYGISDPAYNILIYYFSSVEEEFQNKANNLGAKNLNDLIQRGAMTKIGNKMINGTPAIEVTEHGEGEYYAVYMEKDNHIYKIFYNAAWQTENIVSIENKILSTFKFTK